MRSPLRVLMLEDNANDAELMLSTLSADRIVCETLCVQTRGDFVAAVEQGAFDLILSDHSLPTFDGLSALAIAREKCPQIPFIFVSGTIGEELAIETLKGGATDYVLKHRLQRLGPSIRRAMQESDERAARQRAEKAWRTADALFHSIFESTAIGMAVLNIQRRVVKANRSFEEMLGRSEEDLAQLECPEYTFPDDLAIEEKLFDELVAGKRLSYQFEKRFSRKDGRLVWVRSTVSLIDTEENNPALAVALVEDITERKNLGEKLFQSQKMEAVGRLAAGIAHDFNNVLTVITGYSGLLLSRLPEHDPSRRESREINDASHRATALVKRLLAFSREQICQTQVMNLNYVFAGLEALLVHVVGDSIRLVKKLDPDLGSVSVDPVQIEQVLVNLAINARDAMPEGGELTFSTTNVHITHPFAAQEGLKPSEYVMLEVGDTGTGMDEATKNRIFDPFFTTKEVGKGTGLGLWTVQEVVKQLQGAIVVTSTLNQGTTFKIFLPLVAEQPEPLRKEPHKPKIPLKGAGTILIAETDQAVRVLIKQLLEPAGFRILTACDGLEALAIAEQRLRIDLLVTGVALANANGMRLAEDVRALLPAIKVLYTSGSEGPADGSHYLRKPFTGEDLLQKVREVLSLRNLSVIAVADDDPGIRTLLRDVLEASGHRVLEAQNGKEATALIRQGNIDLLITDLIMPDQEGMETIKLVKRQFPGLPILAMSGGPGAAFLKAAQFLGADRTIQKPFETDEIRKLVDSLLAAPELVRPDEPYLTLSNQACDIAE